MPRTKSPIPPSVNVTRRIKTPVYNATQRWMGQNHKTLTEAIEQGLTALPGIQPLIEEEREAYAAELQQHKEDREKYAEDIYKEVTGL